MGRPIGTGRRKSTCIRAVTPQLSLAASDHAMTSSRIVQTIPPWAMPSQPWNRSASARSVQHRSSETCRSRWIPCSFRDPHAKHRCGATSIDKASTGARAGAAARSDVKVPDLAGLGVDELLPWRDLLAHELREHLVGCLGVRAVDPQEGPRRRVHRRLPELLGVHLAEALEALDGHVLAVHLLDDP